MDPNATLDRMLYLAAILQDQGDPDPETGAESRHAGPVDERLARARRIPPRGDRAVIG